jgi:hypothetical protein
VEAMLRQVCPFTANHPARRGPCLKVDNAVIGRGWDTWGAAFAVARVAGRSKALTLSARRSPFAPPRG